MLANSESISSQGNILIVDPLIPGALIAQTLIIRQQRKKTKPQSKTISGLLDMNQ